MSLSTVGSTTACTACKYQRKKCTKDCLLAPYFPQTNQNLFLNAHRFFGVGNITKMIREVDESLRDIAMQNLFIHANARAQDPMGGLYRIISDYKQKIESAEAELHLVNQQIAFYRSRDQQQQQSQDLSCGCYSYGDLLPQQVDYGRVDGYANQNMYQYQGMEQQLYQYAPQQQQHQDMQPESSSRVKLEKEEQEIPQQYQTIPQQQQQYQQILQNLQNLEIHQEQQSEEIPQQQQYQEIPLQQQYQEIPLQLQQHQQIPLNYGMFTEMPESSNRLKLDKEEQEIPQHQQQYQEILQQLQHQEMQQHSRFR